MNLSDALDELTAGTIIELGCGADPVPCATVGIDLDPTTLRRLPATTHAVVGDAHALPIGSGRADAIIARGLLHHCADLARLLGEARRCLRPDGRLLVLDCAPMPAPDFEEMTHQLHAAGHTSEPRNGIDPNQLRELLREVGFDEIISDLSGTWTNATPPFTDRTFRSPAFLHRAVAGRR